jgi:hypothetical protein
MSRMGGASMNEVSGGLEFGGQNKKQIKRRYK